MKTFLIDTASEEVLDTLNRHLRAPSNNVLAFVGAGMSRQGGLPLWSELMKDLDEAVQTVRPRPDHVRKAVLEHPDLLWQAELFRMELERAAAYERFLRQTFRRRLTAGKEVFAQLARIGFRHFITTNYDTFVEQALEDEDINFEELDWTDRQECRAFFLDQLLLSPAPFVVHIHGRCDYPRSVVLTHRDYVQRYVQSLEYVEKLSVLFATTRIVFIGFSLDDPDLKYILRQVNSRFAAGDIQHFALMGMSEPEQVSIERERLETQFGIAPIFYDSANGHAALKDVLNAIAARPRPLAAAAAALSSGTAPVAPPEAPAAPAKPAVTWNDDPNKGKFGGQPVAGGRQLLAVHDGAEPRGVHKIRLVCAPTPGAPPIVGPVVFHLHPTFPRPDVQVDAEDGAATLNIKAYGAFTVGVECDSGKTRLELDLAVCSDLPQEFRSN